jgi:predicted signal transduction protein with EAL and GGDEF domain
MARQLRLSIIAEGIENAAQAERLRALGWAVSMDKAITSADPCRQHTVVRCSSNWVHHAS